MNFDFEIGDIFQLKTPEQILKQDPFESDYNFLYVVTKVDNENLELVARNLCDLPTYTPDGKYFRYDLGYDLAFDARSRMADWSRKVV